MASSLVAKMVFFIATLFVATIIALTFIDAIQKNEMGMRLQMDRTSEKIKTDFVIESFSYNGASSQAIIHLRNTGFSEISLRDFSVYIGSSKVNSCTLYNATILDDTKTNQNFYWSPSEVVRIVTQRSLNPSESYEVLVTTRQGVRKSINRVPNIVQTSYYLSEENQCTYIGDIVIECYEDNECDDGNKYSLNYCIDNRCQSIPVECMVDDDCDDGSDYTLNFCSQNICDSVIYECIVDNDCDDGDPETLNECIDNFCISTPVPSWCDPEWGIVFTHVEGIEDVCWQKQASTEQRNFSESLAYCDNLEIGEIDSWQAVSEPHWNILIEYIKEEYEISTNLAPILIEEYGFVNVSSSNYWTGTQRNSFSSWTARLQFGNIAAILLETEQRTLCGYINED